MTNRKHCLFLALLYMGFVLGLGYPAFCQPEVMGWGNLVGMRIDGLGGNFRTRYPRTDPAVVQYNLDNLRVAWARVEMPWYAWDPREDVDPLEAARAGALNSRVEQAMEMAQKLAGRGMPVIVSAWFSPSWAISAEGAFHTSLGQRPRVCGEWSKKGCKPAPWKPWDCSINMVCKTMNDVCETYGWGGPSALKMNWV